VSGDSPLLPPAPGDCCECGGRIPDSEPQVTLTWNPNAERLYFHAQCAVRAFVAAVEDPDEWTFEYHKIEAEAN
jgi:hypothetical protein